MSDFFSILFIIAVFILSSWKSSNKKRKIPFPKNKAKPRKDYKILDDKLKPKENTIDDKIFNFETVKFESEEAPPKKEEITSIKKEKNLFPQKLPLNQQEINWRNAFIMSEILSLPKSLRKK